MRKIITVAVIGLVAVITTAWSISTLTSPHANPKIQMLGGTPTKTFLLW